SISSAVPATARLTKSWSEKAGAATVGAGTGGAGGAAAGGGGAVCTAQAASANRATLDRANRRVERGMGTSVARWNRIVTRQRYIGSVTSNSPQICVNWLAGGWTRSPCQPRGP